MLIFDNLFLVLLDANKRLILLEIIEGKNEWKSITITLQYPWFNWYDMVSALTIADALLGRIIHTVHTVEQNGERMCKLRSKKK